MTGTCETCRWFSSTVVEGDRARVCITIGDCRRHPPNGTLKPWPLVNTDWFCGEWSGAA